MNKRWFLFAGGVVGSYLALWAHVAHQQHQKDEAYKAFQQQLAISQAEITRQLDNCNYAGGLVFNYEDQRFEPVSEFSACVLKPLLENNQ